MNQPIRSFESGQLVKSGYQPKYPKAAECLAKDQATLLSFYDFPAEHWHHIRTSNPTG